MASITIDSYIVFNACIKYIEKSKKFWKEMVDEEGTSLLSVTEEEHKFKILSLMRMSSYNISITDATYVNLDNYEFTLLEEYLEKIGEKNETKMV